MVGTTGDTVNLIDKNQENFHRTIPCYTLNGLHARKMFQNVQTPGVDKIQKADQSIVVDWVIQRYLPLFNAHNVFYVYYLLLLLNTSNASTEFLTQAGSKAFQGFQETFNFSSSCFSLKRRSPSKAESLGPEKVSSGHVQPVQTCLAYLLRHRSLCSEILSAQVQHAAIKKNLQPGHLMMHSVGQASLGESHPEQAYMGDVRSQRGPRVCLRKCECSLVKLLVLTSEQIALDST